MDNFFNYIMKPIKQEDVDLWFRVNNLNLEKIDLFYDFCESLHLIIIETYLGDSSDNETKIALNQEDVLNHFNWCWTKTLEDFEKENIFFNRDGDHYDYFYKFFYEMFYEQKKSQVKETISNLTPEMFYWSRDCPLIPVKQSHIINSFVQTNTKLRDALKIKNANGPLLSVIFRDSDTFKKLIYPSWEENIYQKKIKGNDDGIVKHFFGIDTEAFLDEKNKYFFEKYKKFKVNDIYSHSRKNQATKFFNYTYSQGYCIL